MFDTEKIEGKFNIYTIYLYFVEKNCWCVVGQINRCHSMQTNCIYCMLLYFPAGQQTHRFSTNRYYRLFFQQKCNAPKCKQLKRICKVRCSISAFLSIIRSLIKLLMQKILVILIDMRKFSINLFI